MITVIGIVGIITLIITAVFAFGVLNTPYMEAFRVGFYLVAVVLVLAAVYALNGPPLGGGYDPIPHGP
jgi:hypothetical protein